MQFEPVQYRSPYAQPMIYSYTLPRRQATLSRWPSNIPPSCTPPPSTPLRGTPCRRKIYHTTWDSLRLVATPTPQHQVAFTIEREEDQGRAVARESCITHPCGKMVTSHWCRKWERGGENTGTGLHLWISLVFESIIHCLSC